MKLQRYIMSARRSADDLNEAIKMIPFQHIDPKKIEEAIALARDTLAMLTHLEWAMKLK